jgi:surfactin synthase thioesterase subunit
MKNKIQIKPHPPDVIEVSPKVLKRLRERLKDCSCETVSGEHGHLEHHRCTVCKGVIKDVGLRVYIRQLI